MKKFVGVGLAVAALGLLLGATWWQHHRRARHDQPAREASAGRAAAFEVIAPAGVRPEDCVGAKACEGCHPSIYESQSASHMAHALTTVGAYERHNGPLPTAKFYDSDNDIRYEIVRQGDQVLLNASVRGELVQAPLVYVLGSGVSGLTFLHERRPRDFQELRLSFYTQSREWDYTSGQEDSHPASAEEALGNAVTGRGQKCLTCHSTLAVQGETGLDRERSQFGVTCERCHGPGRTHVESARRGEREPIGKRPFEIALRTAPSAVERRELAATRDTAVCGECHGRHAMSPVVPDLYLSRFPIAALPRSKCYQRSLGKLLCTDCHDPHSNAEHADQTPYVQVCLKCHGTAAEQRNDTGRAGDGSQPVPPAQRSACPVNSSDGCIGCHMPKREPVFRGTFTHHRIAVHTEEN